MSSSLISRILRRMATLMKLESENIRKWPTYASMPQEALCHSYRLSKRFSRLNEWFNHELAVNEPDISPVPDYATWYFQLDSEKLRKKHRSAVMYHLDLSEEHFKAVLANELILSKKEYELISKIAGVPVQVLFPDRL